MLLCVDTFCKRCTILTGALGATACAQMQDVGLVAWGGGWEKARALDSGSNVGCSKDWLCVLNYPGYSASVSPSAEWERISCVSGRLWGEDSCVWQGVSSCVRVLWLLAIEAQLRLLNDTREVVKVSHRTNKKSEQSRSEEGMELSSPVDTGRRN